MHDTRHHALPFKPIQDEVLFGNKLIGRICGPRIAFFNQTEKTICQEGGSLNRCVWLIMFEVHFTVFLAMAVDALLNRKRPLDATF